jgi:two-component system, chemotaxis family, CheB/CheR fusion protein
MPAHDLGCVKTFEHAERVERRAFLAAMSYYTTLQADVQRVLRGGEVFERDLAPKDRSRDCVRRIRPYRTSQNVAAGVVITFVDIPERKRAEQQLLISRELQHRTNNLLAVIQSIAGQSLSGPHSLAEARETFLARLRALANANALLIGEDWQGASLEDVIARELASFVSHVSLKGPRLELTPSATQGFALVIHELATNAAKFGALSTPGGQVAISWSVEERGENPIFLFSWQESGGPGVTAPDRNGFATTLLKCALSGEATPHLEYAPQGLHFTLEGLLSAVARESGVDQTRQ